MATAMTDSSKGGIARPRFRADDLAAEAIEDGGQQFVDVIDPTTGDGYRFYETEYALACGMDGERDVAGLARWAADELGLQTTPAEIERVAATLAGLGYLEGSAAVTHAAAAPAPITPEPSPRHLAPAAAAIAAAAPAVAAAVAPVAKATPAPASIDLDLGAPGVASAPAAAAASVNNDFELGSPGVVEKTQVNEPSGGIDFELGAPGVSAAAAAAIAAPSIDDDVELGRPGASTVPAAKPAPAKPVAAPIAAPVAAIAAKAAEVSTDLSVDIGIADVKEAVRASRVMKAVDTSDLPADVAAAIAATEPTPAPVVKPVAAPTPAPVVAKAPEPVVEAKKPVPAVEAKKPVVETKPAAAVAKPEAKPAAAAPAVAAKKTSPVLIAVLVLVILGGIGFALWKFVLNKPKTDAAPTTAPTTSKLGSAGAAVTPPAPPAPVKKAPTTTLTASAAPAIELKATVAGTIESAAAAGPVTVDADLFALAMPSALKTELAELKKDVEERYPAEIAELEAKRDAARAKGQTASGESLEGKASERRGRLAEGKAKLDALITKVDGYVIKAAAAGVFTTTLATGAKVAVGDALGTVTPAEVLRGEVELAGTTKDAASYTVGADVAAKAAGATLTCKVVTIAGTKLTIECPSGAAAAGASIELT